MSDTKRIALLVGLVLWAIFALSVSVRAEEFACKKCGDEVALNIPVQKKLGTSHRVTGDYGGFGGPEPSAAGCTTCNTGNDSELVAGDSGTGEFYHDFYMARQFTIADEKCVTGVRFTAGYPNGTTMTGEIWTDSSNLPGARVGDGFTGTCVLTSIHTTVNTVDFASTQTLAAGTYWIVVKNPPGTAIDYCQGSPTGVKYAYSDNQGSTWTDYTSSVSWTGYALYGCD